MPEHEYEIADRSRRCDCGCGRPAPLRISEIDLAFSTKCAEKYDECFTWFFSTPRKPLAAMKQTAPSR